MGIQSLLNSSAGSGVKVDKSACVPFGNPAGSIALTTAYQTLQSITGKGFLNAAVVKGQASINTIRITVDGIVKFEGSSNINTGSAGIVTRDLLFINTGNNISIVDPAVPNRPIELFQTAGLIFGYPYTANTAQNQTLSIVSDAIYFNTSLLIEAKGGAANTAGYYISGGYQ